MLKQLRYFLTLMLLAVAGVGFAGSITFGELGLENGVQYAEPFDGGDFTVTFAGGGNDGKYYDTGSGIRVYGGGTMTIAANGTITSITITYDGTNKPEDDDVVSTGTYNAATGVWTGSAEEVVFTRPSGKGHWRVQKVEVTVEGGVTKSTATVTAEAESILIGEDADVITDGPEITLTSSDESIVSVNGVTYTGEAAGTATITAKWEEDDEFYGGSKSFTITVVDPNAAQAGTEDNPYTVEQARAAIDAGTGTQGVYATGIVSKIVTAYNSQYGNISYNISDDGTTSSPQLQAYRGFNKDGEWFTSADDVKVGDIVVVYGDLTKYNTTYEFAQGNQLVSLVRTDNREPAGLSYDVANYTATIGETDEFPVLNNPNNLAITYSSTNESVATVDAETGEITLVAAGQATIKAVTEGNDSYEPGEASYLLVVKEPEIAGTDKFELVTDASTLADGDVIILAFVDEENKAWALSTTQNSNNRAANETTLNEDGTITPGSSIQQITLEDGFYFNVGNGYLYAASSSSNWLRTEAEADDNAMADIDIAEDGGATIIFQGSNTRNYLRFNPNGGNPMFSCYAENSSVQNLPRIYRKVGGVTPVVLKDAELAYDVEEFTATIGEDNEFPVLANPNELEVTYTSSNEEVATIDAEGNITLVGVGETTITATSEANDEFKAGEASYVLIVEEVVEPGNDKYELVTDASTLAAGDEILLAFVDMEAEEPVAKAMGAEQASNNRPAVDVVYNDDETLTPDATAQVITLEEGENGWYFNVGNGYLYAASGKSNWLRTETEPDEDDNALATIEIAENGDATIVFQGTNSRNNLRYNPNNGTPIFSCYANSSSVVTLPRIYRKVAQVEEEIITVNIGATGYATLFYSDKALEIPEGVTAQIATSVDDNGVIVLEDIDDIIPAGTGVVLNAEQGSYDFVVKYINLAAPENNLLKGSDEAAMTEGGDKYYKLTVKNGNVGFYWGAEEGGAFENGAHKAYLAVPAGASNAKFFLLGNAGGSVVSDGAGLVDGINEVQAESNKVYYNLNGVRTNTLRKGIYIVDGKKVMIK